MVYILAERKYFLSNNNGKINNKEYDTYEEAELALANLGVLEKRKTEVSTYDKPLYHGDFVITRKQ